jgi:hypothetical protein
MNMNKVKEIREDKESMHDDYMKEVLDDLITVYRTKKQSEVIETIKNMLANVEVAIEIEKDKGKLISKIEDNDSKEKMLFDIKQRRIQMIKEKLIYEKYLKKELGQ